MANIVRKNDEQAQVPTSWDPFETMRAMMSWDPFRSRDPFLEMSRFMGRPQLQNFAPQFDVKETQDAYIFKADLPGIREEDLDISLTGNRLTISGHRESEERREDETWYAYERSYGTFSRSFTLPEGVNTDKINAELKSGVLQLTVPKGPQLQSKKITVRNVIDKVKGVLGDKKDLNHA